MHMLGTFVSTRSCILLVNVPRNDMARSTTASTGICSQQRKDTPHINPLCMRPLGGQGLPNLGHLHIGKVLYHVLLEVCPLCQGTVAMHMCCIQPISV